MSGNFPSLQYSVAPLLVPSFPRSRYSVSPTSTRSRVSAGSFIRQRNCPIRVRLMPTNRVAIPLPATHFAKSTGTSHLRNPVSGAMMPNLGPILSCQSSRNFILVPKLVRRRLIVLGEHTCPRSCASSPRCRARRETRSTASGASAIPSTTWDRGQIQHDLRKYFFII